MHTTLAIPPEELNSLWEQLISSETIPSSMTKKENEFFKYLLNTITEEEKKRISQASSELTNEVFALKTISSNQMDRFVNSLSCDPCLSVYKTKIASKFSNKIKGVIQKNRAVNKNQLTFKLAIVQLKMTQQLKSICEKFCTAILKNNSIMEFDTKSILPTTNIHILTSKDYDLFSSYISRSYLYWKNQIENSNRDCLRLRKSITNLPYNMTFLKNHQFLVHLPKDPRSSFRLSYNFMNGNLIVRKKYPKHTPLAIGKDYDYAVREDSYLEIGYPFHSCTLNDLQLKTLDETEWKILFLQTMKYLQTMHNKGYCNCRINESDIIIRIDSNTKKVADASVTQPRDIMDASFLAKREADNEQMRDVFFLLYTLWNFTKRKECAFPFLDRILKTDDIRKSEKTASALELINSCELFCNTELHLKKLIDEVNKCLKREDVITEHPEFLEVDDEHIEFTPQAIDDEDIKTTLDGKQFKKIRMKGDGNCMFYSLEKAFTSLGISSLSYHELRQLSVHLIQAIFDGENKKRKEDIQNTITTVISDLPKHHSRRILRAKNKYKAYCSYMKQDKISGNCSELLMLSEHFLTPVTIWQYNLKKKNCIYRSFTTLPEDKYENEIHLLYSSGSSDAEPNHYDLLIPISSPASLG